MAEKRSFFPDRSNICNLKHKDLEAQTFAKSSIKHNLKQHNPNKFTKARIINNTGESQPKIKSIFPQMQNEIKISKK